MSATTKQDEEEWNWFSHGAHMGGSWRSLPSEKDRLSEYTIEQTEDSLSRLTIKNYLGFGYGGIGQYIWGLLFGFFMTPFLLSVAQISPFATGTIQLAASIWTSGINPFIGIFSDLSPYPRRMSFILFSIVPFCYFYMLFWQVPPFLGETGLIIYYTVVYFVCSTAFMCYVVPYNALSAEISPNYDERTKLSTYRWVLSLLIGIVAVAGQSLLMFAFRLPDGNINLTKGYAVSGMIMGIFLLTPGIVLYFTINEPRPVQTSKTRVSILAGLKITLTNVPFLMVVLMNSCAWSTLTLMTNNLLLYITYVIQEEKLFPFMLIGVLVCCTIGLPLWGMISFRIGKKKVYILGTSLLIISLFPTTFLQSGAVVLMIILPSIGGLGLGVLYLIPYSMIPDIIEYDELQTGERREGSFFSIFIFCEKLATGLTLALSNYTLGFVGFDASLGATNQPEAVILSMRILIGILPCIMLLISWVACYFYPITKKAHEEILEKLLLSRKDSHINN